MKKNLFSLFVFFYVLLYFALPPVVFQFFTPRQSEFTANYPFSVFFGGIIAFLIYFYSLKGRIFEKPVVLEKKPFFVYSSNILITFGLLCLSSVIFEGIAYFFKIDSGIHKVVFPSGFLGFLNFFFGVIFAAFFEEVIYRFYLPRAFFEIFKRRVFLCEGLSLILFAAGHIYLGIFGFLNALVSGIILRACIIRTNTIWISFAIHALYNFLSFAIAFNFS